VALDSEASVADAHKNFAASTVAAAPSPAASGTTLTVAAGEGARFPAAPFNATVFPAAQAPSVTNAEIVRVTGVVGDVLTVVRTQESTAARSIIVGDRIMAGLTVKSLTDIEASVDAEVAARIAADALLIPLSQKDAANGVATLDSGQKILLARIPQGANGVAILDGSGVLPSSAMPPLAINETTVVADQAAMLALTAQRGDMAIRSDNGRTYVLSTDSPSTLADWKEVLAAGQVVSVNGQTGVVVVGIADIAGLQAALDAKAVDAAVVHLAGTENISGAKTFLATLALLGSALDIRDSGGNYRVSIDALTTPRVSLGTPSNPLAFADMRAEGSEFRIKGYGRPISLRRVSTGVIGDPTADKTSVVVQREASNTGANFEVRDTDGTTVLARITATGVPSASVDLVRKAELDLKISATEKGSGNGVATLDAGGQVPAAQIPAIAITDYLGTVANQAAMLALSGQKGDWAIRSDTQTVFVITGSDPTILAGWTELSYPASAVVSVNGDTGAVVLTAPDVGAATSAQGALADTAVQPGDLGAVATSNDYNDLDNLPTGGTGLPVFGTWAYDQADEALPVSSGTFTLSVVKGFIIANVTYSLFLSGTAIEGSRTSLLGTIRVGDILELRSADNAYRLRMTATTAWSADTIGVSIVAPTSWGSVPANTVMTLLVYPVSDGNLRYQNNAFTPNNATGSNGDMMVVHFPDTSNIRTNTRLVGPKAAGSWPAADAVDANGDKIYLPYRSKTQQSSDLIPGWRLTFDTAWATGAAPTDMVKDGNFGGTGWQASVAGTISGLSRYHQVKEAPMAFFSGAFTITALPEATRFFFFGQIITSGSQVYGYCIRIEASGALTIRMMDFVNGVDTALASGMTVVANDTIVFERFGYRLTVRKTNGTARTLLDADAAASSRPLSTYIDDVSDPLYAKSFSGASFGLATNSTAVRVEKVRFAG
jgi:hypothetical protein